MFDRRKNDEEMVGGRRMSDPQSIDTSSEDRHDARDESDRAAKLLASAAKTRVDHIAIIVRNLRTILVIMFLMMLIAIIVSVGAVIAAGQAQDAIDAAQENVRVIQKNESELRRAEITSCRRAQMQRERGNVSNARQYLILLGSDSRRGERSALFDSAIRSAVYSPPVDCTEAVGGRLIDPPREIPYERLGPEFALSVLQAAVDPVRPQPLPECYRKAKFC